MDPGREVGEFLVETGDVVKEGTVLAIYDDAALRLEKEQLLLDREQLVFDLESAGLRIRTLKRERSQAEASQRGDYDLQILEAEAELERKEYDLAGKDREIEALERKLSEHEAASPCEGAVEAVDRESGSLSIVPKDSYEFIFSAGEDELEGFQEGDAVTVSSRDGSLSLAGKVEKVGMGDPSNGETDVGAARASLYPVRGTVAGADDFLPGQHVYIEKAEAGEGKLAADGGHGPNSDSDGEVDDVREAEILLPEGYVEDASGKPWVWAAGEDGRLEKRPITLGAYNDRHSAWQVEAGLSMTDYLAWPSALWEEGQEADFGESKT